MKRLGALLIFVMAACPLAATDVAGNINANTTWTLAGSPYILTGNVNVGGSSSATSATLTIEAGVIVKAAADVQLTINTGNKGALVVNGTAAQKVLFTSNTTANWTGVIFGATAGAPQSRMTHAIVENAGSTAFSRGGISVLGNAPLFDGVTVRNNRYAGLFLSGGSLSFANGSVSGNAGPGLYSTGGTSISLTGTSFLNNTGYAVSIPAGLTIAAASGLSASGNASGGEGIELRGYARLTTSTTWPSPGIPYIVTGTVDVMDVSAPTLTIAAGTTIRFNANSQLSCNHSSKGAIRAIGTPSAPIVFTSNTTAQPGAWLGLWFGPAADPPQSTLSHVIVEYGGVSSRGGITVNGASPAFDHAVIRNNATAGILLNGGSASIAASTITANGGPGLRVNGGTSLQLTDTSFTNNAGYAVTLPVGLVLTAANGLSASGNATGGDGIEFRGTGRLATDTTWPSTGIPYIVTGTVDVMDVSAPTLTIAPGTTIRFNPNSQLSCNHSSKGAIRAIGTPSAPIVFTSNTTALPGSWYGLWFGPAANPPQSIIAHAVIEYGGIESAQRGGASVQAASPLFDRVIFRYNAHSGLNAAGSSTPRIVSSQFIGNARGIHTASAATVQASLNYWGLPEGPCLVGNCATGQQSVTAAVAHEPWLVGVQSDPLFVVSALPKNKVFNPSIGTQTWIEYTASAAGKCTLTVRNAQNAVVRTLSADGDAASVFWDGANDEGAPQPNGTYTYDLAVTASGPPPATIARGRTTIDNTRALTLSTPVVDYAFFSPNGDSVQDAVALTAATNYDDATWTVRVLDAAGNVIRAADGIGTSVAYGWDGRNDAAAIQPDGVYTLRVEATTGAGSWKAPVLTRNAAVTLDNTLPAATLTSPASNAILSNIYTSGGMIHTAVGSLSDQNLRDWFVQYGAGAAPATWSTIGSGTGPVNGATLASWNTTGVANGQYTVRLRVTDKAGNIATSTSSPVTVGNFAATQSAWELNAAAGNTLTYTSTVPFPVTMSLLIRNEGGTVVRRLVDAAVRNAGTYADAFNGRDDANVLLPDGPYFYSITLTAGGQTFLWDLSSQMRNETPEYNDSLGIQAYDPFNNKPLTFNYDFFRTGRISVATTLTPGSVIGECATPTANFFCPAVDVWQDSGPQSFAWWGLDHTGTYRAIRSIAIISRTDNFPKNAAVLYGSKPVLRNVRLTPPVFGPAAGAQMIEFDLTTHQSQPVHVRIEIVNLDSKSTLRTMNVPNQAPGHAAIRWDGRTDDGMLVAPGRYAVAVTVTDPLQNVVKGGILGTIQY